MSRLSILLISVLSSFRFTGWGWNHLLLSEDQELFGQFRAAPDGFLNFLQLFPVGIGLFQAPQ